MNRMMFKVGGSDGVVSLSRCQWVDETVFVRQSQLRREEAAKERREWGMEIGSVQDV